MASTQIERVKDYLPRANDEKVYNWETLTATIYQVDEHSYAAGLKAERKKYRKFVESLETLVGAYRKGLITPDDAIQSVDSVLRQVVKP